MGKIASVAMAVAAVAAFAAGAWASSVIQFRVQALEMQSAKDLIEVCTLEEGHVEHQAARGFCLGFLQGGKHYHDAVTRGPEGHPILCPDPTVTADEARVVFLEYMEEHRELDTEPPMEAFFRAATTRWPCTGGTR